MFEQTKKGFMSRFLIVVVFVTGTDIPVFAGTSITGAVNSVDGTSLTLRILNDLVEVDASNATIKVEGVDNATISDIAVDDIVKIKSSDNGSGVIEATRIKDP